MGPGMMTFPIRKGIAALAAAVLVQTGIVLAQSAPGELSLQSFDKDKLLKAYLVIVDDSCPTQRVALAFPKDEHAKIKSAVKADAAGPYATAAKEFETNSKIVGPAGACGVAIRKAQEFGANTTTMVPAKDFFAQQEVAMMETAQLRFAEDYCKRLTVDWKARNAQLTELGLDPNARRVKGIVKKQASDIRSRHRSDAAPYCIELYNKWSPAGLLKTKE